VSSAYFAVFTIVDGELSLYLAHPNRLSDIEILSLGKKITCQFAEDLDARFPKECLARLTMYLTDAECSNPRPIGHAEIMMHSDQRTDGRKNQKTLSDWHLY
jgi:2-methylcitrate dehydratase PrpD